MSTILLTYHLSFPSSFLETEVVDMRGKPLSRGTVKEYLMPTLRHTSFPTSTSLLLARIILERAASVDLLVSTFRRVFRLTWLHFMI